MGDYLLGVLVLGLVPWVAFCIIGYHAPDVDSDDFYDKDEAYVTRYRKGCVWLLVMTPVWPLPLGVMLIRNLARVLPR
jgi:hypothetical protein